MELENPASPPCSPIIFECLKKKNFLGTCTLTQKPISVVEMKTCEGFFSKSPPTTTTIFSFEGFVHIPPKKSQVICFVKTQLQVYTHTSLSV